MFMLSIPPATKISPSPTPIIAAASITVFRPEPQILFTVVAPTKGGMPALMAAWRAGAWPCPACTTLPISTSSIELGSILARSTAALMATAPSSEAGTLDSVPWKRPMAVRTALTITTSRSLLIELPP